VAAAPTAAGITGKLTVARDTHGGQVACNGHLLYTFTSDHAGQATGQGFQNFFVAIPGLTPVTNSSAPARTVPAAQSGG
jgi:predicted lipoprotein with Yx(FWY)xxD motif